MSHDAKQGQDIDLIEELAKVFNEKDDARQLAGRADFPKGRMPVFQSPLTFWTNIVEAMRNGVMSGSTSTRPLVEQAVKAYPGNPVFALLNGGPQLAQVAALLEGCEPALLDALEAVSIAYVVAIEKTGDKPGGRILFGRNASPKGGWPAAFFVVAYAGSTVVGGSDDAPPPAKLGHALRRLERYEVGASFRGYGTVPPQERMLGTEVSRHHFTHDDDPAMVDLHHHIRAKLGR